MVFGDKIIALDIDLSLFTVHLGDDELGRSIRPLLIVEEDDDGMVNREALLNARLVVVCGDKLALVGSPSPDDWDTLFSSTSTASARRRNRQGGRRCRSWKARSSSAAVKGCPVNPFQPNTTRFASKHIPYQLICPVNPLTHIQTIPNNNLTQKL